MELTEGFHHMIKIFQNRENWIALEKLLDPIFLLQKSSYNLFRRKCCPPLRNRMIQPKCVAWRPAGTLEKETFGREFVTTVFVETLFSNTVSALSSQSVRMKFQESGNQATCSSYHCTTSELLWPYQILAFIQSLPIQLRFTFEFRIWNTSTYPLELFWRIFVPVHTYLYQGY